MCDVGEGVVDEEVCVGLGSHGWRLMGGRGGIRARGMCEISY